MINYKINMSKTKTMKKRKNKNIYIQAFCTWLIVLVAICDGNHGAFRVTTYDDDVAERFEPVFNSMVVIFCTLFLSCLPNDFSNNDKQHKCGLPHNSLYQESKRP